VARNYLAAFLLIGVALAGCSKKEDPADQPVDLAALRAERDSVAKAKARADSIVLVRYTTCSDSVIGVVGKTAAGRRAIARARGTADKPGTPLPQVLEACGAAPGAAASQVAVQDTSKKTPAAGTPAGQAAPAQQTPAAATASAPGLTPQQRQVARADSIRKAREQAHADSLRLAAEIARTDSLAKRTADSVRTDSLRQAGETEVLRETFTYGGANRDPFVSLIDLPTEGPEFGDLSLVGVYLDLRYAGNSIAVVRDRAANKRYNVRVGDRIGRLKIAQIRQRDVVFTIEDLGFERQETLSLRKQEEQNP
jgi:hypothetical protein